MKLKPLIYIAVGFALLWLSKRLELHGDLAPIDPSGVSPERAKYHIAALVALLGAIGLFIAALLGIFRGFRR